MNVWRMYEITPMSESGYVHAGRGLNEICCATGLRITRDSIVPPPRFSTTDWPLKMPNDGAVTIVVTPVARFASRSSSRQLDLAKGEKRGPVSGSASGAARAPPAAGPRRRGAVALGNPSDVCASMRPG